MTCWLEQAYQELLEGWESTEGESYAERYHVRADENQLTPIQKTPYKMFHDDVRVYLLHDGQPADILSHFREARQDSISTFHFNFSEARV